MCGYMSVVKLGARLLPKMQKLLLTYLDVQDRVEGGWHLLFYEQLNTQVVENKSTHVLSQAMRTMSGSES